MPEGKYTVDEAREEALRIFGKYATAGANDLFLREAKSFDQLIIAIDMSLRTQPFNVELRNELTPLRQRVNEQRRG